MGIRGGETPLVGEEFKQRCEIRFDYFSKCKRSVNGGPPCWERDANIS